MSTLAAALFAALLLAPGAAYADVNNFTIDNFTADYYLTKADPQGEMRVVENLTVTFSDYNHGILRAIPEHYKALPLNINIESVTSSTGAPAVYTTYDDGNDNEVIKIGDANKTVTGQQKYTITYNMQNVVSFYADHDELYWNVNGTGWSQYFGHVEARLHLPNELGFERQSICYAGDGRGAIRRECSVDQQSNLLVAKADALGPGQTLTFVAAFSKGYFTPPTRWDYIRENVMLAAQFFVPFLLLSTGGFVWWLRRGRDPKGTGVIVAQYDAPDDLTPLEVGTLVDFKPDNRDYTATIIDLAIRKYLRIVETDSTTLGVIKHKGYAFELINKDWSALKQWEREFMEGIFGYSAQKPSAKLADLKNDLVTAVRNARKAVNASLTTQGYFASNPGKYVALTIGGALLVPVVAFGVFIHGIGAHALLFWGFAAGGMVLALFYHFMAARTAKGVAAREHALGLKLYLSVAEKDRLEKLQSPDAPYMPKSAAPSQTVELFEKLLPYAIVLGVEKAWAKQFEKIYIQQPDWYSGNFTTFNAIYLTTSLSGSFSSSMKASFAPASSSSGSGFGGGFSGGGGGGGGGGGW